MTILATIVVLGVLIFVHELGHFLAAKSVGVEVQRFSIGLGPTVYGFRRGETEYVLSWIPLGGYVKMGGMDNEVGDRLEGGPMKEPREPSSRDFDAKPIWARTFVISAGVVMNMVFAFTVYVTVNAVWGMAEIAETRIARVETDLLPEGTEDLSGLAEGSRIVRVGAADVVHWGDIQEGIMDAPAGVLEVLTEEPDAVITIDLGPDLDARLRLARSLQFWADAEVGAVNPGSPADRAGLEAGDRILAVDGAPMDHWYDFVDAIEERPETRTELSLERRGRPLTRYVTPTEETGEDPVTGETVRVGKVGIYQPRTELAYQPVGVGRGNWARMGRNHRRDSPDPGFSSGLGDRRHLPAVGGQHRDDRERPPAKRPRWGWTCSCVSWRFSRSTLRFSTCCPFRSWTGGILSFWVSKPCVARRSRSSSACGGARSDSWLSLD